MKVFWNKPALSACILGAALVAPLQLHAEQWRLHPTYDGDVERIIDTPEHIYILSYCQPYVSSGGAAWKDNLSKNMSLFRYSKNDGETEALTRQNMLTGNILQNIAYNPEKRYLLAVHENGGIDFVYDRKGLEHVAGFGMADSYSKTVNDISFEYASGDVFMATDFGYLCLNDNNHEISFTRDFGVKVNSVSALGDRLFLATDNGFFSGTRKTGGISGFEKIADLYNVRRIQNLGADRLLVWDASAPDAVVYLVECAPDGTVGVNPLIMTSEVVSVEPSENGAVVTGATGIWMVDQEGVTTYIRKTDEDYMSVSSSWNGRDFLMSRSRDGLVYVSYGDEGAVIKDGPFLPNSPNAYKCTSMAYHDRYGMLVRNHGIDNNFSSFSVSTPDLLSSYRNMGWNLRATVKDGYDAGLQFWNPNGLAVDPMDDRSVYGGSFVHGLLRLDLEDASNSLRIGRISQAANGWPNFIGAVPDASYDMFCRFSAPAFDNAGNMWTAWYDFDLAEAKKDALEFWYWTPEDRLATKDASSYRPMKRMKIDGVGASSVSVLLPLRHSSSATMLLYCGSSYNGDIVLLDHKGTLDSTGDDDMVKFGPLVDQDGAMVNFSYVTSLYEDMSSGLVWVGTDNGIFTFRPSEMIKGTDRVNRIKVSRNDGTNLADYLLNGATVNCIASDPSGNKWFGMTGGGIAVTNADGTEVRRAYTADNSMLPDNTVYAICHNPENNSMMISTGCGLAELFLSTASSGEGKSSVKVYPNPVRPDYFGYVTIEGLADNALVKVVDGGGRLVKEIGFASGGEAVWDVTNLNSKRVPGGVYYILCSGGPDSESFSAAGKVLVVN